MLLPLIDITITIGLQMHRYSGNMTYMIATVDMLVIALRVKAGSILFQGTMLLCI